MLLARQLVVIGQCVLLASLVVGSKGVAAAERTAAARGSVEAALAQYRENNATLQRANEQLRQRVATADRRAAELAERLAQVERERDALRSAATLPAERDAACEARVAAVRGVAEEAIARYESQGFWDVLWRDEPLTGIGRARTDNAADSLRERLATEASAAPLDASAADAARSVVPPNELDTGPAATSGGVAAPP